MIEVILGIAAITLLLWMLCKKPEGLPPGRWGLPLIGYFPLGLRSKYIDEQLQDFQKEFGDVYVWRIGTQVLLFIHDYSLAKQAFSSQEFTRRPDWAIFKANQETALGVAFSNDDTWHSNRKFTIRQLKDLGMGKSALASAVQTQARKLVEAIKEGAGKPGPITPNLNTAIVNVIWQMVGNKQFEKDSPRLLEFQDMIAQIQTSSGALIFPDIFTWVKAIMPNSLFRKLFGIDYFDMVLGKFFTYFHELIDEHRAALDPDDPKDLIDAYLLEMEEKNKNNNNDHWHEKGLVVLIFDLFFAGTDTTTNTLKFMFLYMAAYPEVQRKVQREIDEALPKGTLATLEDKSRLQYTEAMLNEVLRMSSLANTGLQHRTSQDTQLAGYKIPKDTIVMASFESIHHDPRYWDKPDCFLPERWLDSEGKIIKKKEGFMPFSIGKRNCIGESLARMEFLIFGTAVLQNFNISPPEGKMIDLRPDYNDPLGHDPRKQDVVFTLRG